MKNSLRNTVIIGLVFISLAGHLPAQTNPFPNFDSLVNAEMKRWKIPGLAIAIVEQGKVVLQRGYGVREIGKPGNVDENTIFAIGSNTKAFTGTLMALLESENKLSLNDKVRKYIPGFTLYDSLSSQSCNLTDILCHRIGYQTFAGDFVAWGTSYSTNELIYKLRYLKPSYEFRTRYGYFNMGFVTAGEILKRVSGREWASLVKERILVPLDMTRTFTSVTELGSVDNVAMPHTYDLKGNVVAIPYRQIDAIGACGALNSSVADMAKWLNYQLDTANTPIPRNVIWSTWKANTLIFTGLPNKQTPGKQHFGNYGLGWFLNDYSGKLLISHSGGVDGMLSRCGFFPELGVGVVVLTNYDDQDLFETLFYLILDKYFGDVDFKHSQKAFDQFSYFKEKRDENLAILQARIDPTAKVPVNIRVSMVGKFSNPHYGELEIVNDKKTYSIKFNAHPNLVGTLTYIGNDEFLLTYNDPEFRWSVISFEMKGNHVQSFKLDLPDFLEMGDYVFVKK